MTEAAEAAHREAEVWAAIADRWQPDRNPEIWSDLPAIEERVIPGVQVQTDLGRISRRWGFGIDRADLSDVALFAAALAKAEAEAWDAGDPIVATQAYEDRRFLAADRVVPWAVPWLRAVARCFPDNREDATRASDDLLEIGEHHRLAPLLAGSEGLYPPGYDGYGPVDVPVDLIDRLGSLWGGMVVFDRSVQSIAGDEVRRRAEWQRSDESDLAVVAWYEVAAARWESMAAAYPGTASYWMDLAHRARATARLADNT